MVYQTAKHLTVAEQKQRHRLHDGIRVVDSVTIQAPAKKLFEFWSRFENLPLFIEHLESVTPVTERKSRWVWKALNEHKKVEWESELIESEPDHLISWKTSPDSEVHHAGSVMFRELAYGRGTVVTVRMVYEPPMGGLADIFERIVGESPQQNLMNDLKKLRQLMELGELPRVTGQPSGGQWEEINPALH